jgi:hypothetical protein
MDIPNAVKCVLVALVLSRSAFCDGLAIQRGFFRENDALPLDVVNREFAQCDGGRKGRSLNEFDYRLNESKRKYVTVLAQYYTGCTPGRLDYPILTNYLKSFYEQQWNEGAEVASVVLLKNGVNDGICEAWMSNDAASKSKAIDMGGLWPIVVDDSDRALTYSFFDAEVHPTYVVLDHCLRVAASLPAMSEQNGTNTLNAVVIGLMANVSAPCEVERKEKYLERERVRKSVVDSFVADGVVVVAESAYCVEAFGQKQNRGAIKVAKTGLKTPRAISFNGEDEIWIATADDDSLHLVTLGTKTTSILKSRSVTDRAKYHYLDKVSQIAFGLDGNFATCQESSNDYNGMKKSNYFMGPTLYDSGIVATNEDIFIDLDANKCDIRTYDQSKDSCFLTHEDMLHATPLCMGIAHDGESKTPYGNVFWAFDGHNNSLVRYDFEKPHGPKSLNHDLANVRRYDEVQLKRVPNVPSHIVVDATTRAVYIADTGNNRIVVVNADSGRFVYNARKDLGGTYSSWSSEKASFEYSVYGCAQFNSQFIKNLDQPSGIAIKDNLLYVAEYGSGKIKAFQKTSGVLIDTFETGSMALGGISFQPNTNRLWYVCRSSNSLRYIDVSSAQSCSGSTGLIPSGTAINFGVVPADGSSALCPALQTSLGIAVHVEHSDGYLNTTMLTYAYGQSASCLACDDDCDNDMLLMAGWLCHVCLPEPCENNAVCQNVQGEGYSCVCPQGYSGDRCQTASSSSSSSSSIKESLKAANAMMVLFVIFIYLL